MLARIGTFDRVGEAAVHRQVGDRFREDHVGAGLDAGARALDRRVQPFDRQRVGARHDDEVRDRCARRRRP